MRYFYCDDKEKVTKKKSESNKIESNKSESNKSKKLKKKNTNAISGSLTMSGNLKNPRVRLIARHLYNNSVI